MHVRAAAAQPRAQGGCLWGYLARSRLPVSSVEFDVGSSHVGCKCGGAAARRGKERGQRCGTTAVGGFSRAARVDPRPRAPVRLGISDKSHNSAMLSTRCAAAAVGMHATGPDMSVRVRNAEQSAQPGVWAPLLQPPPG